MENVSRGLLAVIGAWLVVRALRGRPHRHGEGAMVGVVAGLVPCPLTLFAMFLALAMMLGVSVTLSGVALLTILARDFVVRLSARYGASIDRLGHGLDALAGVLLVVIGARELLT